MDTSQPVQGSDSQTEAQGRQSPTSGSYQALLDRQDAQTVQQGQEQQAELNQLPRRETEEQRGERFSREITGLRSNQEHERQSWVSPARLESVGAASMGSNAPSQLYSEHAIVEEGNSGQFTGRQPGDRSPRSSQVYPVQFPPEAAAHTPPAGRGYATSGPGIQEAQDPLGLSVHGGTAAEMDMRALVGAHQREVSQLARTQAAERGDLGLTHAEQLGNLNRRQSADRSALEVTHVAQSDSLSNRQGQSWLDWEQKREEKAQQEKATFEQVGIDAALAAMDNASRVLDEEKARLQETKDRTVGRERGTGLEKRPRSQDSDPGHARAMSGPDTTTSYGGRGRRSASGSTGRSVMSQARQGFAR